MSTARYYEDELNYLRDLGDAFSRANPTIAGLLSRRATDPDVERLLEGFAFLTGKLRQRLDEELPELSHGLLSLLWPQALRPVPALTVMEFDPDPSGGVVTLPSGTEVASRPVEGIVCRFRTCGPLPLRPIVVRAVAAEDRAGGTVLTLTLAATAGAAADALANGLRLFVHGGRDGRLGLALLRALLRDLRRAELVSGTRRVPLPLPLRHAGFDPADAVLPPPDNGIEAHRLLAEFLAFPDRFLFVDLPPPAPDHQLAGATVALRLEFDRRLEMPATVTAEQFRTNCVPAANLFDIDVDPIRPDPGRTEYRVRPPPALGPHARVHAVRVVHGLRQGQPGRVVYEPFESFRHALPPAEGRFHRVRARPAVVGRGAELYLSFVDGRDGSLVPDVEVVTVAARCSNGQAAERLGIGAIDHVAAGSAATGRFRNITPVIGEAEAALGGDTLWRLVAGLARSQRPLARIEEFRALVAAHDPRAQSDSQARRRLELLLAGLRDIATSGFDLVLGGIPIRGREITLTVDRNGFAGLDDVFLFGAVLNQFLAVYAGLNTAWRLVVHEIETNTRLVYPTGYGRMPPL